MKKVIFNTAQLISIAFVAWVTLSFVNVVAHNMTDQAYAVWNLFTLIW